MLTGRNMQGVTSYINKIPREHSVLPGRNRALLLTDKRSQGTILYTEQTTLMRNNVVYVYLQKEIKI